MEGGHVPLGRPEPVEDATSWLALLGAIGTTIVAAGGAFVLLSFGGMARTAGASRSARLKWQERGCEVERAVRPPERPADRP